MGEGCAYSSRVSPIPPGRGVVEEVGLLVGARHFDHTAGGEQQSLVGVGPIDLLHCCWLAVVLVEELELVSGAEQLVSHPTVILGVRRSP